MSVTAFGCRHHRRVVGVAIHTCRGSRRGREGRQAREARQGCGVRPWHRSMRRCQPAKILAEKAQAILVFPRITKASLGVGGQRGTGTLLKDGKPEGFYTTTGASVGLQAGAKTYGYALFFMNDNAVQALSKAKRLRGGRGPDRCRGQQGNGEEPHDDDAQVRHLCGHFRPEGPHGRRRNSGEQDHEGEPQVARRPGTRGVGTKDGGMEDIVIRFLRPTNLIGRLSGPLTPRLFLQPAVAIFLAVRDGVKDAREQRPPHFLRIVTGHPRYEGVASGRRGEPC